MTTLDDAAIIILDTRARISFWSDAADALFGHRSSDVVGTLLENLIPEPYRHRHRAGFAAAVASGETRFGGAEGPVAYLPLVCRDGRIRRYPGRQVVIRDPSGGIAAIAGVFAASVSSTALVPRLYPVDGETGSGDMVTGGEPT